MGGGIISVKKTGEQITVIVTFVCLFIGLGVQLMPTPTSWTPSIILFTLAAVSALVGIALVI